jgi:hypothetical protein
MVAAPFAGVLLAGGTAAAMTTPAHADGTSTVTACKRWVSGSGCVETTTCRCWSDGT